MSQNYRSPNARTPVARSLYWDGDGSERADLRAESSVVPNLPPIDETPTSLPLVSCHKCKFGDIVELTLRTEKNYNVKFFKCSLHERGVPGTCNNYMWLSAYVSHLKDEGLILPSHGAPTTPSTCNRATEEVSRSTSMFGLPRLITTPSGLPLLRCSLCLQGDIEESTSSSFDTYNIKLFKCTRNTSRLIGSCCSFNKVLSCYIGYLKDEGIIVPALHSVSTIPPGWGQQLDGL